MEGTVIGAGELATRRRSVGLNKSTQRTIHRRTRCKDTFVTGRTQRSKGKVTTSPKVKVKVNARAREKHSGQENRNQDQAGSPDEETGQRALGDFGVKRQRIEFVGDAQENDGLETPRADRAAYVFFVQKCKSVMMDSTEYPSSSTRFFHVPRGVRSQRALMRNPISPQERCFSPLDVETIDQLLTLEVLCQRAQWIVRRQFRQRKSITV